MKEMLDAGQAANYLRLARQTLARLRCVGSSPVFYKVGRQVLYDRADLDCWLDQRRRISTSDVGAARDGHGGPDDRR
jgi:excisionase family DNA binding protein